MGSVKSYYVLIRNRDKSFIPATGRRFLKSSRCSNRQMAEDLKAALLDNHPEREGLVVPSGLRPEISPDGPVR